MRVSRVLLAVWLAVQPGVAVAEVAVRAVGTVDSSQSACVPGVPAGHATNDVELLFVETANQDATLTTAAGFVLVTGAEIGTGTAGGTNAARMEVFWRRWNGSDGAPTVGDSGNRTQCRIIGFTGVITSGDPFANVVTSTDSSANVGVNIANSGTAAAAGSQLVAATARALPNASSTAEFSAWTNANTSTGCTERIDNASTAGNGGAMGVCAGVLFGTTIGTTTATAANSAEEANVSLLLVPTTPTTTSSTTSTSTSSTTSTTVAGAMFRHYWLQ